MTHPHQPNTPPSDSGAPRAPGALRDDAPAGSATSTLASTEPLPTATIPPSLSSAGPYIGATIDGRYRVESVLGEGGMGVVYLARHKVIDKKVAIKVLRAEMAREKEVTERFLQEAKSASSIGNPHIIDISDFGELPDGSTYFVMEYLDGTPLGRAVETGRPMPVPRLLTIAHQIADALASAHQRGIVHRDLKPDNIFLVKRGSQPDFVKILDFGIAKVTTGTSKLTRAGSIFGTPHYMSPEQAAGAPVDLRTDVYALGVILYEMASGRVPFDADNFMGILTQHMYKAPVPIRALVPTHDVPPGLEAVILKALSKKPEQRYQTMEEFGLDLERLTRGAIPEAIPDMMSRSGGFNVPADFFQERGMAAPVPATPYAGTRRAWGVYAGVAGVVAAIAIVAVVFANSSSSTASLPGRPIGEPMAVAPTPGAPIATTAPAGGRASAPTPSAEPLTAAPRPVLFGIEPFDAHVFLGSQDLGSQPVTVDVPAGETVTVEVRREGYRSQPVTIDGSEKKIKLRLVKVAAARPAAPPAAKPPADTTAVKPPPPAAPPALGGGEIVNPWAK